MSSLIKVSVGQSRDVLSVIELGHSVNGVCSMFGCFIKFKVKVIDNSINDMDHRAINRIRCMTSALL